MLKIIDYHFTFCDLCSERSEQQDCVEVEVFGGFDSACVCPQHLVELQEREEIADREEAELPVITSGEQCKEMLLNEAERLHLSPRHLLDSVGYKKRLARSAVLRKTLGFAMTQVAVPASQRRPPETGNK